MKTVGVDVGGTFTDIMMIDTLTGMHIVHKLPSTPESQDKAVIQGIRDILKMYNISPTDISLVVHGTTVATNSMLERKGAQVALLTTEGLEDILEIGRQNRDDIYDLCSEKEDDYRIYYLHERLPYNDRLRYYRG